MMIETKLFEVRDRSTFIPVIAIRLDLTAEKKPLDAADYYLLRRAGYDAGLPCVLLTRLDGGKEVHYDPELWEDRTYHVAHEFIISNWAELPSGAVVDVEFVLGESRSPKLSERLTGYGV